MALQTSIADSALIAGFDLEQCRAALAVTGLQKIVEKKVRTRIRQLESRHPHRRRHNYGPLHHHYISDTEGGVLRHERPAVARFRKLKRPWRPRSPLAELAS